MEAIVTKFPAPQGDPEGKPAALIFDCHYDPYRGVIVHVRIKEGRFKTGDQIKMMSTGREYKVEQCGIFKINYEETGVLEAGDVGYIISGLKTVSDVKVGDTIIVNGVTGVVDSINLISVRVHTLDNEMVRIPNSSIINTNLMNKSYHNKRRLTLSISISYDTDMKTALEALSKAPSLCPTVLDTPAPAVWFDGFADSGINMTVAVWFKPEDFLKTKNDLYIAMKQVFDEAGIEIPFNQLDVKIKK